MATLTKPQAIEIFHLAFLQVLPQHLPPLNYAVKGGANLRLFLGSVRRSEDIDFNFVGHVPWSLQPRIDAALKSPALGHLLAIHGIKIVSVNPSKTTSTTGRWKFQLAAPGVQFNSKLEFSMRQEDRPLYELASVSPTLAAAARMRPAVANHYLPAGAMEQKIAALALRTETQARDIFDLDFLITRYSAESLAAQPNVYELDLAGRRVFEVTYREYLDLVVTYIDPAFVSMYRSEEEWERIALNVATRLDSIRAGVR
jgi:hypothetical protein